MELSNVDLAYLREFVREIIAVCNSDDVGITLGLYDLALNAGVILGLSKAEMENIE